MTELMQAERFEPRARVGSDGSKVLTFALGRETFALVIDGIKEIIEYGGVTRVPMTPRHLRGVINLRGNVVPVIGLAERLGRPASAPGRRSCIVVVEVGQGGESVQIGLVVDAVAEVLDIGATEVEPAPSFGATIDSEYILGMGRVRGRFVVILDQERLLAVDELARFA